MKFNLKKSILYEDEHLFVINKPSGLMVHGDGRSKEKTLSEYILEVYPELETIGEPVEMTLKGEVIKVSRPGIVHRLDKETSGVLLIAKDQPTFLFIKKQFQEHKIKKTYHAIAWGTMKDSSGTITAPIGRSASDFRKWHAGRGIRGETRDAVTQFYVLRYFEEADTAFSYLEVHPKTGRTHQIRVHLAYRNHPIVGDSLYASKKPYMLGFDRLALHAYVLTFTKPDGEQLSVQAPLPELFEKYASKV